MAVNPQQDRPATQRPNQGAVQGCLTIILRIICAILGFLCKTFGRSVPWLCRLEELVCKRVSIPPTTELTQPTGCTGGTYGEFPPASGIGAYLVEIRGKAFGGAFTGYKLGYRADTTGAFIENDANIIYPNNQTNADLGLSLFPTPVGPAEGTLGRLNATFLTEGSYQIQLRAESGGTTRTLIFDLNRDYIQISKVSGMNVPNYTDENSQVAEAVGGNVTVTGSADTGGCADRRVDSFTLEFTEGHLSQAAMIALPPSSPLTPPVGAVPSPLNSRALILKVDYTADPVFSVMARPRLGELTIKLAKDTYTIVLPPPITIEYGVALSSPLVSAGGSIDRFNVTGLHGRYTLLLTVNFNAGPPAYETQQIWIDNRVPVAWISRIEQEQNGTWVDVSGCEPISKSKGANLRFLGVGLDPLILPTPTQPAPAGPVTEPNNNFSTFALDYSEDGLSTFVTTGLTLSLPPGAPLGSIPGTLPIGTANIDSANGQTLIDMASPVQAPSIATAGELGTWDISSLDPCAYVVRLRVWDKTVVNAGGSHYNEFFYAVTITA